MIKLKTDLTDMVSGSPAKGFIENGLRFASERFYREGERFAGSVKAGGGIFVPLNTMFLPKRPFFRFLLIFTDFY